MARLIFLAIMSYALALELNYNSSTLMGTNSTLFSAFLDSGRELVISSVDDIVTVCDMSCQKFQLDQRELIIDTSGGLIEVCIGESCTHQKLRPCHWSCDSCNAGK